MDHETVTAADLRVEGVMTRRVFSVAIHNTMSEAADFFFERQITGAPVVDQQGRCVGVLSAMDFVHSKAEELVAQNREGRSLCSPQPSGAYRVDAEHHDLVGSHMSPAVHTVDQSAKLITAARCMCQERVHRLVVLDVDGSPVGILTSLDLINAMVAAHED